MPNLLSSDSDEDSDTPQESFKINEGYAKRLEHNKAREELHRLQAKYGDKLEQQEDGHLESGDDETTSESEDEVGELVTPELDAKIWQTIAMIRERRPEVYDGTWKGFAEDDEGDRNEPPRKKEKKEKPMYLKDYHRRNLLQTLEGGTDETPLHVTTYDEEQRALKEAFHSSLLEDEEDEDLIKPKSRSKIDKETEEQEYQQFLRNSLQDEASQNLLQQLTSLASAPEGKQVETEDDGEAFLAKYLLNRGWLEPSTTRPALYEEDETDDDDKAEEFETQYNFRYEQPGAGEVITHARTLSTARRGDERRKKERERKRAAKEAEKNREMEEIARLRNLRRMELEERIRRIEGVAGAGGWTEKDLEGDFDPEEWDNRMQGVFDDDYYLEEDKKKPKFDDDIDISDLVGGDGVEAGRVNGEDKTEIQSKIIERKPTKREKLDKKRKIEDYLDEHLPFDKPKDQFPYREVSPDTFGLTQLEILTATDAQLNEFVGLKKLGPYRSQDVKMKDKKKYGKKKRLREWRRKVEQEGEGEEIKAVLRPDAKEAPKPVPNESASKKKKRKSRKSKSTEEA